MRKLWVVYGVAAYLLFAAVFLWAVGFVEGVGVPVALDGPAGGPALPAAAVDALLLGLFAVQHSVMARRGFKAWWTRFVPRAAERSTYVLASSLALALVLWQWQPVGGVVWRVESPAAASALRAVSLAGWILAFCSTFLINHLDLFGLRQVWLHARGEPYRPPTFTARFLYRYVRHPLMLGFLVAFWATPVMTAAHLLFAALTTGYILVGIHLEERDLLVEHGERYAAYRRDVPMLVPSAPRSRPPEVEAR